MAGEGAGQQFPGDSASEYDALSFIIEQKLANISTARLVQVKAVDTGKKTVDVQPMVNMVDGDMNATEHGTIFGIPYVSWQFGKNAIEADPVVGDKGMMMVCDRDISAVKASKKIGPPGSPRKFSMSDGVYFGAVRGMSDDPDQFIKFTDTGIDITLKNNNRLTADATGWQFFGKVKFNNEVTVDDDIVVSQIAKITGNLQLGGSIVSIAGATYSGNFHTSGSIQVDTNAVFAGINFTTHRHSQSGGGNTGTPFS